MSTKKERLYQIIKAPHVTEKTAMSDKQIVFKVENSATKAEIKEAVEAFFGVKVANVRVLNQKGKQKVFRMRKGKQNNVKKAYISLVDAVDYEKIMAE